MIVQTKVPKIVAEKVFNSETVQAKTDYENGFSKLAYQLLSKRAKMENFFFGMVVNSDDELDLHLSQSNANNAVVLTLDIPESDLFIHDYYDFSSLIYDAEGYDGVEVPLEKLNYYADNLQHINDKRPIQVVFQSIKPEYLVSA